MKGDSANPFDMDALSLGLGEAEAEGIHRQRRDAKQLHSCANQAGCDHIVYEERTIVREKNTPATRKTRKPVSADVTLSKS